MSTLVDLLQYRAQCRPEQCAYTFLLDGEEQQCTISYGELDRQARAIAAHLQGLKAAGQRALLLYPSGLEYIAAFFGCLYAGVLAVPVYPPQANRFISRLHTIAQSAQASIALTTSRLCTKIAQLPGMQTFQLVATDAIGYDEAAHWSCPDLHADSLAFLQYTSGSTATPRGVMLTHRNLLHNLRLIYQVCEHSPETIGVSWAPLYHDMGLIGGILQPLYGGFAVTLLSPLSFLQKPFRWLQAISRLHATSSGGANFAYDLCVQKITPQQRQTLDLSQWQIAFSSAEPVRSDTLARFAQTFEACGFRSNAFFPCYGLAEATLVVACGQKASLPLIRTFRRTALARGQAVTVAEGREAGEISLVGHGSSLPGQRILIVDPQTARECAAGTVGEIWVAGDSVAQGYWQQPEETERLFHASVASLSEGAFLRTGDLGFWYEGDIFLAGRLKDVIIIRGRNHFPQDIEDTVAASHPALPYGGGAAFSVEVDNEERLVVVQEIARQGRGATSPEDLLPVVIQAVAEQHDIQVYAVVILHPGTLPRTSSGKVQRHICREHFLAGTLAVFCQHIHTEGSGEGQDWHLSRAALLALPEDRRLQALEAYLRGQTALALRVSPQAVSFQRSLAALGSDSLGTIALQHTIEADLQISLPISRFFQQDGLAHLAEELLALCASPVPESQDRASSLIDTAREYTPSPGQQALWFLHQLAPLSTAYTIAVAVGVQGDLQMAALRQAWQALTNRHVILRTRCSERQGQPVLVIGDAASVHEEQLSWHDADTLQAFLAAHARRPFHLQSEAPVHLSVFQIPLHSPVLCLVAHHSVVDFLSLAVLLRDLADFYQQARRGTLIVEQHPDLRYFSFVQQQAEMLAGSRGRELQQYWEGQLASASPVLSLPADRPRPLTPTYAGATYDVSIDADLAADLRTLARAEGVTLSTLLVSAFLVLLYRTTSQEDILLGVPMAARPHAQFADVIGYFVNPIVLRARFATDMSFLACVQHMHMQIIAALEHQDYPFPLLVERLHPERVGTHMPLYQVMFAFQGVSGDLPKELAAFALHLGLPRILVICPSNRCHCPRVLLSAISHCWSPRGMERSWHLFCIAQIYSSLRQSSVWRPALSDYCRASVQIRQRASVLCRSYRRGSANWCCTPGTPRREPPLVMPVCRP